MSIFDTMVDFDNVKEFKRAPDGKYLAIVTGYEGDVKNPKNGNEGFKVKLALQEARGGQDLDGVDLSKIKVTDTQWWTNESAPIVTANFFRKVLPDKAGQHSLAEMLDAVVGQPVVVDLYRRDFKDKKGKPGSVLEVANYEAV